MLLVLFKNCKIGSGVLVVIFDVCVVSVVVDGAGVVLGIFNCLEYFQISVNNSNKLVNI